MATTDTQQVTLITRPQPGLVDQLVVDAVITETHSHSNRITDHPVEQGADVSDHVRPEPDRVQLEIVVTNSPLSGTSSTLLFAPGGEQYQTTGAAADSSRSLAAYDRLLAVRDQGLLLTISTSVRVYRSMAIESLSVPRDVKQFGALRFQLSTKRITVVQNKLTRRVVAKDPRAGRKVRTGAQVMVFTEDELYGKQSGLDAIRESASGGALQSLIKALP